MRKAAQLHRHVDRGACEVSVTIAGHGDPLDDPWPIGVTDLHGEAHRVALSPGAGLLYQGTRVPHWRDRLAGTRHYQMFLHYVDADGPSAGTANDALES